MNLERFKSLFPTHQYSDRIDDTSNINETKFLDSKEEGEEEEEEEEERHCKTAESVTGVPIKEVGACVQILH